MCKKLPFGTEQIGKSLRNEITPGGFVFRTREFGQMELEFFCQLGTDMKQYQYYKDYCMSFLTSLGINSDHLCFRDHTAGELAFCSKSIRDIEYNFHSQIGWGELQGIADRADYDLKQHQEASRKSPKYLGPVTNEKYLAYYAKPAVGVERLMLAFMCGAYNEEELKNDTHIVIHLRSSLAPTKACAMPLSKRLSDKTMEIPQLIVLAEDCDYSEAGNIGKQYRRQDVVGIPFCVTVNPETESDNCATVRHRDSMEQEHVSLKNLGAYTEEQIKL